MLLSSRFMDTLAVLFGKRKTEETKTDVLDQHEALIKQAREQFQTLIDRGLQVPVALL